ncbi:MAG: transmembrane anchor protein [Beijerinckiaceae bacterium]|nr:transmembrane anchor protein [Beijerinckiaceae bacterium]
MYNTDIPTRAELPSTAQLIKSTVLALIAAVVILVTIVLPAEHAIDPTGIGRMLKLTQMGEIRQQLAAEAEADRIKDQQQQPTPQPEKRSGLMDRLASLIISPAAAQERIVVAQAAAKKDELTITLKPTEGVEYKLTMVKGAAVQFDWTVEGGVVNYDMHGTPKGGGKETSYKTERGVAKQSGTLTAGFDGSHGWFWRNRGTQPVTIKLKVEGAYSELKKM